MVGLGDKAASAGILTVGSSLSVGVLSRVPPTLIHGRYYPSLKKSFAA
jgi:hypothetical protein